MSGAYFHDGLLNLRDGNAYLPLILREKILVRGDHNVLNVPCCLYHRSRGRLPVGCHAGSSGRNSEGGQHRQEFVRELRGVRWYNDLMATAPERSMAAIRSFDEPIVLLLGGRDKDLPWDDLMQLADERVDQYCALW